MFASLSPTKRVDVPVLPCILRVFMADAYAAVETEYLPFPFSNAAPPWARPFRINCSWADLRRFSVVSHEMQASVIDTPYAISFRSPFDFLVPFVNVAFEHKAHHRVVAVHFLIDDILPHNRLVLMLFP